MFEKNSTNLYQAFPMQLMMLILKKKINLKKIKTKLTKNKFINSFPPAVETIKITFHTLYDFLLIY